MDNIVFRTSNNETATETRDVERQPESQNTGASEDISEPIKDIPVAVLESFELNDDPKMLGSEETENLTEIGTYINQLLKKKDVLPTKETYKETLDNLREEMGIDKQTDPQMAIDRISGVIKAWRDLSFIKDPHEKRSLFMKLARCSDSKAMNKTVFEIMEDKQIWL